MLSVKEALRDTIDLLTEEEAYHIWEFAQRLHERPRVSLTISRLARDPAFRVPAREIGPFQPVEPVDGKGIPASRLLLQERFEAETDRLILVASDHELKQAAQESGLVVIDPEDQETA